MNTNHKHSLIKVELINKVNYSLIHHVAPIYDCFLFKLNKLYRSFLWYLVLWVSHYRLQIWSNRTPRPFPGVSLRPSNSSVNQRKQWYKVGTLMNFLNTEWFLHVSSLGWGQWHPLSLLLCFCSSFKPCHNYYVCY